MKLFKDGIEKDIQAKKVIERLKKDGWAEEKEAAPEGKKSK